MTTDNTQELDEILSKLARDTTLADRAADIAITASAVNDASKRYQWSLGDAKQSILDWHNRQIEALLDRLEAEGQIVDTRLFKREIVATPHSAIEAERNKLNNSDGDVK